MARGKPRRGGRRNRKNFVALNFNIGGIALGTLGDDVVISGNIITMGEDFFALSVDALITIKNMTVGEGPIHVGFAHSDLSNTEIGEALSANLSDPDDIIAKERNRRPVRRAGIFPVMQATERLDDGRMLRTRLKFSIGDAHALALWARNESGAALTTGSSMDCTGVIFGRWQR